MRLDDVVHHDVPLDPFKVAVAAANQIDFEVRLNNMAVHSKLALKLLSTHDTSVAVPLRQGVQTRQLHIQLLAADGAPPQLVLGRFVLHAHHVHVILCLEWGGGGAGRGGKITFLTATPGPDHGGVLEVLVDPLFYVDREVADAERTTWVNLEKQRHTLNPRMHSKLHIGCTKSLCTISHVIRTQCLAFNILLVTCT